MEHTLTHAKTKVAELSVDEHAIVHISFPLKGVPIQLKDSEELLKTRVKLTPKIKKQLLLADLRNNPKPDRGARNFANSEAMNQSTKALAFIVNNGLNTILGNLFIGFNKGKYPVKLFKNKDNAVQWLNSHK